MSHKKSIKKDGMFLRALGFIALTLLSFSEIFYINTWFGPVSIFLLLCIPVTILWMSSTKKIVVNEVALTSYSFILILGLYTLAGVIIYERPTLAIQFLTLVVSPLLFINLGFFGNKRILALSILLSLSISFIFAASQFIYFGTGYIGPFSIFSKITDVVIGSQNDFGVENIVGRSSGIFTSPNILGFFGGIVFWVLVFFKNELSRPYLYVGCTISFFCIVLSNSRGSIFAFILSVVGFLLTKRWASKVRLNIKSLGIFLCVLLISLVIAGYYLDNASSQQVGRFVELSNVIKGNSEASQNFSARIDAWSSIADKISLMPFGTILPPQLIINESPDNQFIYYLAQGGYALLFLSILFYFALFFLASRMRRENRSICIAILIFSMVNSLSITAMNSFTFMIFWLFLGLFSRVDSKV